MQRDYLIIIFVLRLILAKRERGFVSLQESRKIFLKGERVKRRERQRDREREGWLLINWRLHLKSINLFRQDTVYLECQSISLNERLPAKNQHTKDNF
jgi:hypothetical protein